MKYYNKINRNLDYKARLYFNADSYNREGDLTPRFWVELVDLNSVERVGFTEEGSDEEYAKYANRFYGKKEEALTDAEIVALSEEVKDIAPYGYGEDSERDKDIYLNNVKYNPAYQSFYKKYWEKHKDKILQKEPYPCIEVSSVNEVVNTKYITKEPVERPDEDYYNDEHLDNTYHLQERDFTCLGTEIEVHFTGEFEDGKPAFYVDGEFRNTLFIGRHKKYTFTMVEPWADSFTLNGELHPFRITRQWDGVWEGTHSLISGVAIDGAGHSPGKVGNKVILATDEHTPNTLYYHSPMDKDVGGIISVHDFCDGNIQVSASELMPEPDWHTTARIDLGDNYYLAQEETNDYVQVSSSGVPDHVSGHAERGWFTFPNFEVPNTISVGLRTWNLPKFLSAVASRTGHHATPQGPIGTALNGIPFFNSTKVLSEGTTSNDSVHTHVYHSLDAQGNGWTDWAVHTTNPNIKHRHRVTNWVVEEDQSECYPNCEDEHGDVGVGPHAHTLQSDDRTKNLYVDVCNGRPDVNGLYHYYKGPQCSFINLSGEHSPIVGYAFDGYPIYGPRDHSGLLVTSSMLDEHHGHYDAVRGWHYHVSHDFPYVVGTHYKGVPEKTNYTATDE